MEYKILQLEYYEKVYNEEKQKRTYKNWLLYLENSIKQLKEEIELYNYLKNDFAKNINISNDLMNNIIDFIF
jgi:hypothetical protein